MNDMPTEKQKIDDGHPHHYRPTRNLLEDEDVHWILDGPGRVIGYEIVERGGGQSS